MKKIIVKVLVGASIFVAVIIGNVIGKTAVKSQTHTNNDSRLDSLLIRTASEFNSKLPMMVDAETRLDSTAGINKEFRYNYTLIKRSLKDVSAEAIQNALSEKITNNVCTTKEMNIFVGNNVTVSYAYYSKEGKQITVISVPASKCKDI